LSGEKNALFISYIFPPEGGPGAQRILKFVKYIGNYGWFPFVLTATMGSEVSPDPGLLEEVVGKAMIYRAHSFVPDRYKDNWRYPLDKIIRNGFRFFDFLFVPDDKVGWVRHAVKLGKKIIKKNKIDMLFSTGPPFSAHLVAMELKKYSGLAWVADFRDEWTQFSPHFQNKRKSHIKIEERMEKEVFSQADRILCATHGISASFTRRYLQGEKLSIITNGYDEEDFEFAVPERNDGKFLITHSGSLYRQRSPASFIFALKKVLASLPALKERIEFHLAGNVDSHVRELLADEEINDIIRWRGFISHKESIALIRQSDLLLLVVDDLPISDRILTGKIFEYLAAKKPILCLAERSYPVAMIIDRCNSGITVSHGDIEGIERAIRDALDNFTGVWKHFSPKKEEIKIYDRKALTLKLADLFDNIISSV